MKDPCRIPNFLGQLFGAGYCTVAYVGASITLSKGASNVAETSWRALFQKYLFREFGRKYHGRLGEAVAAIGGCASYAAVFTVPRNVLSSEPALTFVEFALNDDGVTDKELAAKGIEGIVRQLLMAKKPSDIILVASGNDRDKMVDGSPLKPVDHTLHRKMADHYGLPFVDAQGYIEARLAEQGQTCSDVYEDTAHLNDAGQQLYFEAIQEVFVEQIRQYEAGNIASPLEAIPEPLVSDELQFFKLIDASKKHPGLVLEGQWDKKPDGLFPWYFDNLMLAQPGAKATLTFTGTAVAVWTHLQPNGLKVDVLLDGKEERGLYLKMAGCSTGFGFVVAHGLPHGEHVLELTVAQPSKRHNKLENPTADIAYFGVASRPEEK